jgi:hypothetical protein
MTGRALLLDGSYNVRDLGGLPSTDGGVVRAGLVFRGDYPAFADDGSGGVAHVLRLRAVVDLRRGSEAAVECVRWADHAVTYHRFPIVARNETSWTARYPAYLACGPRSVVDAVRAVLDPASHPVLFHCAAGKDRTGVVAALVLSVLGVSEDDIVDDYMLSDAAVEPVLSRLARCELYRRMLAGTTAEAQRPHADAMRSFLSGLARSGGAARWLVAHGLTDSEIAAGREALVPAP